MLKHDYCIKHGFTLKNTLMIDSDSRKVQFDIDNSLVNRGFTKEDVNFIGREGEDSVLKT